MDTKALRQKILDLAIRGKLVPQDPNDEPASILLERIREQKKQMVKDGKLKPKDIKKDTVIFKGDDNLHYERFNDGTVKCIEDEIPFELPEGWEWCNLGLITDVFGRIGFRGYTKNDLVAKGKGAITLSPSNIIDNKMDYSSCTYISWAKYEESPEIMIHNNDILLVKTGSSYGKSAFVEDLPEKATINPQFVVLKETRINPQFLCYFLQSNYAKVNFDKLVVGTAIPTFSQANLNAMYIAFPGINEQKRIVNKILELLKYIDTINDEKKCLQSVILQTKSKILDLAIHGKLVPQDPNDEPASVLLERIRAEKEELIKQGKIKRNKKESVIFKGDDNSYYEKVDNEVRCIDTEIPYDLPDGWIWCRLGNIGEWQTGATPSRKKTEYYNGTMPWIKTGDLNNGYIKVVPESITELAITNTSVKIIPENTVIIAMYGATIGKVGITTSTATTNQACCACCNPKMVREKYLFYFLMSYKNAFVSIAEGGAQPNISKEKITATLIPFPSIAEQIRIYTAIDNAFSVLDYIEKLLN